MSASRNSGPGEPRRDATRQDYRERILLVLQHIQRNLDAPLSLAALAEKACFSPFHFHRVFTGMVGETVMEHVRRLRLERAAHKLKFSDEAVTDIALRSGYETHESFTRAFRAHFGCSPSEFRREHGSVAYPASPSRIHFNADAEIGDFQARTEEAEKMQVRIERMEPVRVAYVRHVGPYNDVGPAWGMLFAWAGRRGLIGPNFRHFGMCHDDPDVTPADKLRYDACLAVGPNVQPEGEIGVQDVPGGEFAVAVHHGPYSELGKTYSTLCGQWLPASGRSLGPPPSIERYMNDPRSTPPEKLLTEVWLRLA